MEEIVKERTLTQPARAPLAWRSVLAVVAAAGAVHLAVATRFGWHHDEFYYVICGRHLAWGYVDQPPLTPVLARLAARRPAAAAPAGHRRATRMRAASRGAGG